MVNQSQTPRSEQQQQNGQYPLQWQYFRNAQRFRWEFLPRNSIHRKWNLWKIRWQFILLVLLSTFSCMCKSEGNIGCKYVRILCLENTETCFDDNIFGKCIPIDTKIEDMEKTTLTEEQIRPLADMLQELQGAGLGWDHPYVQCQIQGTLFALQKQTQLPPNLCTYLAPTTGEANPNIPIDFVPSLTTSSLGHASEYYFPPLQDQNLYFNNFAVLLQQLQNQDRYRRRNRQNKEFTIFKEPQREPQLNEENIMDSLMENNKLFQKYISNNPRDWYDALSASEPNLPQTIQKINELNGPTDYQSEGIVQNFNASNSLRLLQDADVQEIHPPSLFRELTLKYNQPKKFLTPDLQTISTNEKTAAQKRLLPNTSNNIYQADIDIRLLHNSLTPKEEEALLTSYSDMYYKPNHRTPEKYFTEGGGLMTAPRENRLTHIRERKEKARRLLANLLGFTRRERLDVKKPGPLLIPTDLIKDELKQLHDNATQNKEIVPNNFEAHVEANKSKKIITEHSASDHALHTIDTEYTHVFVKNPIDSWNDGVRIVNALADILHMQGYFTYLTIQPHEVSFRVNSNNPEHKTATDVARAINENPGVKLDILRSLGVTLLTAGIGDRIRQDNNREVLAAHIPEQSPNMTQIITFICAGAGAAAILVIVITLLLIRKHNRKRGRFSSLSGVVDTDCSKDYQNLCRSRMAEKVSNSDTIGRVTSQSCENEKQSPSTRSSTSSWCEELTLTNLDISTGHMVLSYMEDHLQNKSRLEREWDALCRYEAEPNSKDAASNPQCANLNRLEAPLPYDHSRVVLNCLLNADDLDYINASLITDHDPRVPAYIASQAPLPATLPHFWQMIWEQGTVVIVALCRLHENGKSACARYWPTEGAEVYNMYEVHLVSAHTWCDDYLVRSFYLKNLRTGETRTITQFHFLSWPPNGVPAQTKSLLDFRRKVNKSYRGRSSPIVVHGSTGAGRTGAYILLDLVLARMKKGAREIDIAATLEHLRDQRASLVSTRQQFEFVLSAVAEEVHVILKALPTNDKKELENSKEVRLK